MLVGEYATETSCSEADYQRSHKQEVNYERSHELLSSNSVQSNSYQIVVQSFLDALNVYLCLYLVTNKCFSDFVIIYYVDYWLILLTFVNINVCPES